MTTPAGARAPDDARGDEVLLPSGPCPACEREVLAYPVGDVDGAEESERWACVRCDGPVRAVEWVGEDALETLGFGVHDPLAGGCGTGCGTGCATKPRTIDEILARHRRL